MAATATRRTDVHSPTNLVTEDYEFVGCLDWVGTEIGTAAQRRIVLNHALAGGRHFASVHPQQQCDHCGAHLRYAALLIHTPTNTIVEVGETCLDNRFGRATAEFQKLRELAQLDRAAQRIRSAVMAFQVENPDLAFLGSKDPNETPEPSRRNTFLADLGRKLQLYGGLSDRQISAARGSLKRDAEWAAKRATDTAAHPAAPVVTGSGLTITGEVLSTKVVDGHFGSQLKMLVRDDRGFKVWGTVPASLGTPARGERVSFRAATVEASKDDPTFGFFSRPSQARFIPTT